jgi:hypothetical protein
VIVVVTAAKRQLGNTHTFVLCAGMNIYHYTSTYIKMTQIGLRLGMSIEVHKSSILLTSSQFTLENT